MFQSWTSLTFLHWRYDPVLIQKFLPAALQVDTYQATAWVGLTPFRVRNLRPPFMPAIPWMSSFPETNVRTYVLDRQGNRGIWFFSLDADRLLAVVGARVSYRLPYRWARMSVRAHGDRVSYSSRRFGHVARPSSHIEIETGQRFAPQELSERDHFLTARWRLYTTFSGRLLYAQVEHPRWPLARARVIRLEQTLLEAAGLPAPQGSPLVHYSVNVDVRVSSPRAAP